MDASIGSQISILRRRCAMCDVRCAMCDAICDGVRSPRRARRAQSVHGEKRSFGVRSARFVSCAQAVFS